MPRRQTMFMTKGRYSVGKNPVCLKNKRNMGNVDLQISVQFRQKPKFANLWENCTCFHPPPPFPDCQTWGPPPSWDPPLHNSSPSILLSSPTKHRHAKRKRGGRFWCLSLLLRPAAPSCGNLVEISRSWIAYCSCFHTKLGFPQYNSNPENIAFPQPKN